MPVQCGWSRSSPPVTSSWGSRFVLLMFFPLGCLKQLLKMELLPHFERVLSLPPCFSVGFWCCSPPPPLLHALPRVHLFAKHTNQWCVYT